MKRAQRIMLTIWFLITLISGAHGDSLPTALQLDANLGEISRVQYSSLPDAPIISQAAFVGAYETVPTAVARAWDTDSLAAAQASMPPVEIRVHLENDSCSGNSCGTASGLSDAGIMANDVSSDGGFGSPSQSDSDASPSTVQTGGISVGGGGSGGSATSQARSDYDSALRDRDQANSELNSAVSRYNNELSNYRSARASWESAMNELRRQNSLLQTAVDGRNAAMKTRNDAAADSNAAKQSLFNSEIQKSRLEADQRAQEKAQSDLTARLQNLDKQIQDGTTRALQAFKTTEAQGTAVVDGQASARQQVNQGIDDHNKIAAQVNDDTHLQEGVDSIKNFLQDSNGRVSVTAASAAAGLATDDAVPIALATNPEDPGYVRPEAPDSGVTAGLGAEPIEHPAVACGSIIHVDSLALGESLPLVGTGLTLTYWSDRGIGRRGDFEIHVPLASAGRHGPSTLKLEIAGRTSLIHFNGTEPNFDYAWDGLDGNGRVVMGRVPAQLTLTMEAVTGGSAPAPVRWTTYVGNIRPQPLGLGDWGIGILHEYSPAEHRLYLGSGGIQDVRDPVRTPEGFRVPSADGTQVYMFDERGQHRETRHGLTGSLLVHFSYDDQDRLEVVTDAFQNATHIERESSAVKIVSPFGKVSRLQLNSAGQVAELVNPDGSNYAMTYTSLGLLQSLRLPGDAPPSEFTYDSLGYLLRDQGPAGQMLTFTGNHPTQDTSRVEIDQTSAEGRTTKFSLIPNGNGSYRRETRTPDKQIAIVEYQTDGAQTSSSPGQESKISFAPDVRFGPSVPLVATVKQDLRELPRNPQELVQRQEVAGASADPFNFTSLTTTIQKNGRTWTERYQAARREFVSTSPAGRTSSFIIDAHGLPLVSRNAAFLPRESTYDDRGRLAKYKQGTRTVAYTYDDGGNVAIITDPLGRQTHFEYDQGDRLTRQTSADGRETRWAYDERGQLTTLTPPGRPALRWTWNWLGEIAFITPPTLAGETPATQTSTHFAYNRDKQVTRIELPGGDWMAFDYEEPSGRLEQLRTSQGPFSFAYDVQGRMTQRTSPNDVTMDFTYANQLLLSESTQWPIAKPAQISYQYNGDLQIARSELKVPGADAWGVDYLYDVDGLLTSAGEEKLGLDPASGQLSSLSLNHVRMDLVHDVDFGEISRINAAFDKLLIFTEELKRDLLGRITQVTEIAEASGVGVAGAAKTSTWTYDYDLAGRLARVMKNNILQTEYRYDENGNWIGGIVAGQRFSASYDAQDRLVRDQAKVYTYSPAGRRISQLDLRSQMKTTFDYDISGFLTAVHRSGQSDIKYLIDPLGRRIARQEGEDAFERYVYQNQLQVTAVLDSQGHVLERFVYASKPNVPDYMIKDDQLYSLIADHLGSVRLVVNARTGEIAQALEYDERGLVISDSQPGFQPFGYAGGLYDPATQLMHFGARDYDPQSARFLTKDPLGPAAGGDINPYRYVGNNPVNMTDPMGLFGVQVGVGGSAAAFFFGGAAEAGVAATYSPASGLQYGTYEFAQGRMGIGGGVGVGVNVTVTPAAQRLADLRGPSLSIGAEALIASGSINVSEINGRPATSVSFGLGPGVELFPYAGLGYTSVQQRGSVGGQTCGAR